MYPSSVSRRKKVEKELFDTLHTINPGEFICKLLKSQGNYLFSAQNESGSELLLSIPERFRSAFYFASGDYVLCSPLDNGKVRGEIRSVLKDKQIEHLQKLGSWPQSFSVCTSKQSDKGGDYLPEDMLPSSSSEHSDHDSY
ncbi:hypothetical protein AHF37_07412 [Paragonimus kellicotti]|nr:hypothetical protein AHF37_07412 [Paragonimus kellicotti]